MAIWRGTESSYESRGVCTAFAPEKGNPQSHPSPAPLNPVTLAFSGSGYAQPDKHKKTRVCYSNYNLFSILLVICDEMLKLFKGTYSQIFKQTFLIKKTSLKGFKNSVLSMKHYIVLLPSLKCINLNGTMFMNGLWLRALVKVPQR